MTKKPKTSTTGSLESMGLHLMVSIKCHAEAYALHRVQDCCHEHELLPKRAKETTKSTKRDNIPRDWVDKNLLHIPESSTIKEQYRRCLTATVMCPAAHTRITKLLARHLDQN
jgi:hypothetical protein